MRNDKTNYFGSCHLFHLYKTCLLLCFLRKRRRHPLVLFPGENKKVYLGVTNSEIGDYYDKDGNKANYFGLTNKKTITAAFASRIVDNSHDCNFKCSAKYRAIR